MHSYDIGTEPGVVPEVLQLGRLPVTVVGEVAGEAHGGLGHGPAPSWCLAGRSALPWNRGDGGHRGMPLGRQGQAVEPTKSAQLDQLPSGLGSGAGFGIVR